MNIDKINVKAILLRLAILLLILIGVPMLLHGETGALTSAQYGGLALLACGSVGAERFSSWCSR